MSIVSAGYLDGNTSSILICGQDFSMNKRGINIVVLDKDSVLIVDKPIEIHLQLNMKLFLMSGTY